MITYFNGYYNARRLFYDAEDEIKTVAILTRGKEITPGQSNQIPDATKQKFGQVIDKCSNILAFHSSSNLVDNALLLIGKSFFYQTEYLKAERKFAELLAQFPNSSLALEAELWYARTEEKLGKIDDCVRLGNAVVLTAQTKHNNEIETQAHQLLGKAYRRMNQTDTSIAEYEKVISISSDDAAKSEAQICLGDIYFADGQYKKAADVYLRTEYYTSDIYSNYYSKLQASIAYRIIGEQRKELTLINAMIDDFRNKEYLPAIFFERANNYAASGKLDDAIIDYIRVDTSYAHSEYAVRSAYKLGLIFEKELGLYTKALKYYTEVNAASGSSVVPEGRRKFAALTRYFDARHRLNTADSLLLVLSDTTHKMTHDTLNILFTDSLARQKAAHDKSLTIVSNIDSIKARNFVSDTTKRNPSQAAFKPMLSTADSMHVRKSIRGQFKSSSAISDVDSLKTKNFVSETAQRNPLQAAVKPVLPSADSLRVLKSIAAQELGDIFYSEIIVPDSAFFWYNKSLSWSYDHKYSPRVLYILAELSRTNPEKKFPVPEEYHLRLDHDFPESIYAEEARRFLRKTNPAAKTDTAFEYYLQSEKQIDSKQYEKAIGTLRSIVWSFPKSIFAAKSEYAIGWIMENCLNQTDSAIVQYKRVKKNYEGTMYALAASKRYTEVPQSDTAKIDTIKINIAKADTSKIKNNLQIQKSLSPENVLKNLKGYEKDTAKTKNNLQIQKPLGPDSIQKNLKGLEKDTTKAKNNPPIQRWSNPDSLQRNLNGSKNDTIK